MAVFAANGKNPIVSSSIARGLLIIGCLVVLVAATSSATLYFADQYQKAHPPAHPTKNTVGAAAQAQLSANQALSAALAAISSKKYSDAITDLKNFITNNPKASSADLYAAQLNLGNAYMATKDYKDALVAYQAAEKISGTTKLPEALGIAGAAQALNNKTLALQYLNKAKTLTTDPNQLAEINIQISAVENPTSQ